jgi:hypothetical protein
VVETYSFLIVETVSSIDILLVIKSTKVLVWSLWTFEVSVIIWEFILLSWIPIKEEGNEVESFSSTNEDI